MARPSGEIRNRHREESGSPLPVAQAIAYVLELLPAFGFLHRRGLLYCDFKPDNAIQVEEQLKLIDLGGVRAMDDDESDLYGTVGYQAPEVGEQPATVSSDLYTVARTLAVLCLDLPGFQDPRRYATSLPPASDVPAFRRYEALHQFLVRATAPDPALRFASAADMAVQLRGVLRQVVAVDGTNPPSEASRLFSAELGQGPPVDGWRYLPVPIVDPSDPVAPVLAPLAAATPGQAATVLRAAPPSPERSYQLARTLLEAGDSSGAALELEAPEVAGGGWRTAWWRGIAHLASERPADAAPFFAAVAAELPGELAPRLASALADGARGGVRPRPRSGSPRGRRRIPAGGRHRRRLLLGLLRAGPDPGATRRPRGSAGRPRTGRSVLQRPPGSPAGGRPALRGPGRRSTALGAGPGRRLVDAGPARPRTVGPAAAVRDLLVEAVTLLAEQRAAPDPDVSVGGSPLEEVELRQALETTYRALAKLEPTADGRRRQVDLANAVRPRTRT